jgi:hypothetical protein
VGGGWSLHVRPFLDKTGVKKEGLIPRYPLYSASITLYGERGPRGRKGWALHGVGGHSAHCFCEAGLLLTKTGVQRKGPSRSTPCTVHPSHSMVRGGWRLWACTLEGACPGNTGSERGCTRQDVLSMGY